MIFAANQSYNLLKLFNLQEMYIQPKWVAIVTLCISGAFMVGFTYFYEQKIRYLMGVKNGDMYVAETDDIHKGAKVCPWLVDSVCSSSCQANDCLIQTYQKLVTLGFASFCTEFTVTDGSDVVCYYSYYQGNSHVYVCDNMDDAFYILYELNVAGFIIMVICSFLFLIGACFYGSRACDRPPVEWDETMSLVDGK